MKFTEIGLNEQLLEALSYMKFEKATPVQEQAIPAILNKKDILACAQTGTGKTAAFMLPVLHKLAEKPTNETKAVVIVPTRELAIQIDKEVEGFSYFTGVDSLAVYGGGSGSDFAQERKALEHGANIIIATPGKLISHLKMGYVNFDTVEYLILDEADRMLDIGFHDDIMKIISHVPKTRQSLMFSATMPNEIKSLANKILNNPVEIAIAISKPAEGVLQGAYLTHDEQKIGLVKSLIDGKPDLKSILIFSSTKKYVSELVRHLRNKEYEVRGISSDYDQSKREEVLMRFKSKQTRVLVATDVLSRGIDIKDINLVINFDVPSDAEDYVHRIGRTARASTTGIALTFINKKDMLRFHKIEELIGKEVRKIPLPPELGKGPEWSLEKQRKKPFNKRKGGFKKSKKRE